MIFGKINIEAFALEIAQVYWFVLLLKFGILPSPHANPPKVMRFIIAFPRA